MFDSYEYDQSDEHKQGHTKLLNQLTQFQSLYLEGNKLVDDHLLTFLKKWLTQHILEEDMRYVETLSKELVS